MPGHGRDRLVALALRCYPRPWRARHGEEALELARLLAHDGVPLSSTAWSYFKGAARDRLAPKKSGRRLRTGVAALVTAVSLAGVSLAISVSPTPAGAVSVVRADITNRAEAARQLEAVFRSHHFDIVVVPVPVPPSLVGSIVAVRTTGPSTSGDGILGRIAGSCVGGADGCTRGILLPAHFAGHALLFVGRLARAGETYASADIFRLGEMLARRDARATTTWWG
jgi:hypothetical protein